MKDQVSDEIILKLLKGNKEDVLLSMEYLWRRADNEIVKFYQNNSEQKDTYLGEKYLDSGYIKNNIQGDCRFYKGRESICIYCGSSSFNGCVTIIINPKEYPEGMYSKDSINLYE